MTCLLITNRSITTTGLISSSRLQYKTAYLRDQACNLGFEIYLMMRLVKRMLCMFTLLSICQVVSVGPVFLT